MGLADLHALVPLLAAAGEKSKTPFYICGALLAVWAVVVSIIGVTRPGFPGGLTGERAVIGVSVLLVALTITMAVVTASKPAKGEAKAAAPAPAGGAPGAVALAADPSGQLKFDRKQATAKAGRVTIDFTNSSPVPHNVTIQQGSKNLTATATISQSKTSVSATLQPGTYTFYCSVDAHRQSGMVGTLKVG